VTSRTKAASYPDRETAQWCTQEVVTRNEQIIHRWLAQGTRRRLVMEASWPSKPPVGQVSLGTRTRAGSGPVQVHAARVVIERDVSEPHGFTVHATFPIHL